MMVGLKIDDIIRLNLKADFEKCEICDISIT